MELNQAEYKLGIKLTERHRTAMLDLTDPIHDACDFLVLDSPFLMLCWLDVNESLRTPNQFNHWPTFLVAFASNGCGDYFAYDTRSEPPKIRYIDPDYTVDENLAKSDGFEFMNFEEWYEMKLRKVRRDAP